MQLMDEGPEIPIVKTQDSSTATGRIIRCGPGNYLVKAGESVWHCRLKGRLRAAMQKETNLICVGDYVSVDRMDPEPGTVAGTNVAGTAIIDRVLPRTSSLTRRSPPDMPTRTPLPQVLAANVDLVVIVVSAVSPPLKMGTIERYLILARQAGIEPLVCVNKIDQIAARPLEEPDNGTNQGTRLNQVLASLGSMKVRSVTTSAQSGFGIDALHERLENHTSVFVGPSGAGKTSLLKRMVPGLDSKTLSISAKTNKGRHSTTWSSLVDIGNGYVADLPGLRAIGFWQLEEDTVRREYQDIEDVAISCKFRDCTHTHEPGCAVKAAVQRGELDDARYRRYVKVMSEAAIPRTR